MNLYMIDLDGTIIDARRRYKKAGKEPAGKKTSKTYNKWVKTVMNTRMLKTDPEIKGMLEFIDSLRETGDVIFVTSREENHRAVTTQWLQDHGFWELGSALIMRPKGNLESDHVLKEQAIKEYIDTAWVTYDQVFVVDDDLKGNLASVCRDRSWIMLKIQGYSL